ncbi:MAG: hypothetical protein ACXAC5_25150 [Promethearchaeota archaeon]|jgi:hypothetical protein
MGQVVDMAGGSLLTALFAWLITAFITKKYGRITLTGLTEEEKAAKEEKRKKK